MGLLYQESTEIHRPFSQTSTELHGTIEHFSSKKVQRSIRPLLHQASKELHGRTSPSGKYRNLMEPLLHQASTEFRGITDHFSIRKVQRSMGHFSIRQVKSSMGPLLHHTVLHGTTSSSGKYRALWDHVLFRLAQSFMWNHCSSPSVEYRMVAPGPSSLLGKY